MNRPSTIRHHNNNNNNNNNNTVMSNADNTNNTNFIINYEASPKLSCNDHLKSSSIITHRQEWITQMIVIIHESPKLLLLLLLSPKFVINFESSGQIGIIFHQPRFPWNFREFPLLNHHHLGWKLVFEVVIIWPDPSPKSINALWPARPPSGRTSTTPYQQNAWEALEDVEPSVFTDKGNHSFTKPHHDLVTFSGFSDFLC